MFDPKLLIELFFFFHPKKLADRHHYPNVLERRLIAHFSEQLRSCAGPAARCKAEVGGEKNIQNKSQDVRFVWLRRYKITQCCVDTQLRVI